MRYRRSPCVQDDVFAAYFDGHVDHGRRAWLDRRDRSGSSAAKERTCWMLFGDWLRLDHSSPGVSASISAGDSSSIISSLAAASSSAVDRLARALRRGPLALAQPLAPCSAARPGSSLLAVTFTRVFVRVHALRELHAEALDAHLPSALRPASLRRCRRLRRGRKRCKRAPCRASRSAAR